MGLTVTRTRLSPQEVLQRIRDHWGPLFLWGIAVRERHADGFPHIHVYVAWERRAHITATQIAIAVGKWAHISNATLMWLKYLIKKWLNEDTGRYHIPPDDDDFASLGFIGEEPASPESVIRFAQNETEQGRGGVLQAIATIAKEQGVDAAKRHNLGLYMRHHTQIHKIAEEAKIEKQKEETLEAMRPWVNIDVEAIKRQCSSHEEALVNESIAKYLNWFAAIRAREGKFKGSRKRNLWIFGASDTGKSRLFSVLGEHFFRIYTWHHSTAANWQDGFKENDWDMILIDEFQPKQLTLQTLNLLCEGRQKMDARYQAPLPTENMPIIIISNLYPQQMYELDLLKGQGDVFKAMMERFNFVHIPHQGCKVILFKELWTQEPPKLDLPDPFGPGGSARGTKTLAAIAHSQQQEKKKRHDD